MSIRHLSAVWDTRTTIIKGNARLLMLALADNANHAGYSFPGLDHLALKTGISKRHVMRLIAQLEEEGLLSVIRENGKVNQYYLDIHNLSTMAVDRLSEPVTPCHPRGDTMSPDPYKERKREKEKVKSDYLFDRDLTSHWPADLKTLVISFLENTALKGRSWTKTEATFLAEEIEARGLEQAKKDLTFSIKNGYKSYCHAKPDYQQTYNGNGNGRTASNGTGLDALSQLNDSLAY